jgi:hypothetical protein
MPSSRLTWRSSLLKRVRRSSTRLLTIQQDGYSSSLRQDKAGVPQTSGCLFEDTPVEELKDQLAGASPPREILQEISTVVDFNADSQRIVLRLGGKQLTRLKTLHYYYDPDIRLCPRFNDEMSVSTPSSTSSTRSPHKNNRKKKWNKKKSPKKWRRMLRGSEPPLAVYGYSAAHSTNNQLKLGV